MKISSRIFLGYFLIIGVGVYYLLNTFTNELRPAVRQSAEESLVEMANLLATMVEQPFQRNDLNNSNFSNSVKVFLNKPINAKIFDLKKTNPTLRVYITNDKGIVLYDSSGQDLGADYSQWNDVYLTLKGRYGARSTQTDPNDENTSVMHVAAPIKSNGRIIGVLTVAKPNAAIQPFIESSQTRMFRTGLILFIVSLFIGLLFSVWFSDAIRKLAVYTKKISLGQRTPLPKMNSKELSELANSVETMREALEGKEYVENYIHTLTHEMKSPLSAIKGAAELLHEDMTEEQRKKFLSNVLNETHRLQDFINRMLDLAAVEKKQTLENTEKINIGRMLFDIKSEKESQLARKQLDLVFDIDEKSPLFADSFLLKQAISNLIDNAMAFSPVTGEILISAAKDGEQYLIKVIDQGEGIPEYALNQVFDRFYSLPSPDAGIKSSGIGLSFVKEVAQLHGGIVNISNQAEGGVVAEINLPIK